MFVEIRKKYLTDPPMLPFVVCTAGETTKQAAVHRPDGWHTHHVLMVTGGKGVVTVDGETFTVTEGDGFFCRKGVPHAYRSSNGEFATLWITFLGGEGVLDYYNVGDSFKFTVTPILISATRGLCSFCLGNSTVLGRSAAGYSWYVDWLNACFAPSAPITVQVRSYLEAYFSKPLTLQQVADAVHMSRYALCHYYKETCGVTVMEMLRNIRIEKAKQLLVYGNLTVEEIGKNCGFENPSYFGKIFRQQTGYSPREYRNIKGR